LVTTLGTGRRALFIVFLFAFCLCFLWRLGTKTEGLADAILFSWRQCLLRMRVRPPTFRASSLNNPCTGMLPVRRCNDGACARHVKRFRIQNQIRLRYFCVLRTLQATPEHSTSVLRCRCRAPPFDSPVQLVPFLFRAVLSRFRSPTPTTHRPPLFAWRKQLWEQGADDTTTLTHSRVATLVATLVATQFATAKQPHHTHDTQHTTETEPTARAYIRIRTFSTMLLY